MDKWKKLYNTRLQKSLTKTLPVANSRDPSKYVMNCSSVQLSDIQVEALSYGLNYKVPPTKLNRIYVEAQFENVFHQLSVVHPVSQDKQNWFRNKLTDIAYDFIFSPIRDRCALSKKHLQALRELSTKDVIIIRPDKGSGAVVLDKEEYLRKMETILADRSKFKELEKGTCSEEIEKRVNRHLELLLKLRLIDERTYRSLKPCGTTTPQLYGLPKTHKDGLPLRPVLAMANSPYHKLARWLVQILTPLRHRHNRFGLKDTFELVNRLESCNVTNDLMCSADVQSLFTNVPLRETVDYICTLVEKEDSSLRISMPVELLKESLLLCTENIDFDFLNTPYRQIDGVAMGSPLGPVLADFFMMKIEEQLASEISGLPLYTRYVDDTLIFCRSRQQMNSFIDRLNSAHPNLVVTCEYEENNCLPFLDVLISRRDDGSVKRSVYRKSTWTGQYLHFTSFTPLKEKRALVKTLFSRARKICSDDSLGNELQLIKDTLLTNGYPERFINKHSLPITQPTKTPSVEKLRVYIELPFKGETDMRRTTQRLSASVQSTYNAAEITVINRTQGLPLPRTKGDQAIDAKSHRIYRFRCISGNVRECSRHFRSPESPTPHIARSM